MHLIKNKNTSAYSSTTSLQINKKITSSTSNVKAKNVISTQYKPETERDHPNNSSKINSKNQGIIARALSNTKSIITRLITKQPQNGNKITIGQKYVYSEQDLIGKGYSSQVYKCAHINNLQNKNLAVKILDLSKIKGFLFDLLTKQIKIHRKLQHDNIVKCFDVIQTKSHIYIIQQYCSGGDLGSYISLRKKKITEGEALKIMSQIVDGYKYLIKEKILHRDLKPCNIFRCGKNKTWKIGDFGFSCLTQEQLDDVNVGTPIYMPPQSLQNSFYSHKSDFFALGVIMYEMIYGKVPWFSKSQSLLVKKMKQIKLNFQVQNQTINNSLIRKFIQKCCEIDKQKRICQQDFLKLELFPKQGLNVQRQKQGAVGHRKKSKISLNKKSTSKDSKIIKRQNSNLKKERSKIKGINSSSIITVSNLNKQKKIQKSVNNKNDSKYQLQKSLQTQPTSSINLNVNLQKKSKLSQYSTQPQTRVLHEQNKSILKTQHSNLHTTSNFHQTRKPSIYSPTSKQPHTQPTPNNRPLTSTLPLQLFKINNQILYKQIQFCKHLYYMIKNINYFNIKYQKRQQFTIIVYKHIVYLLKKLKNIKFNYFDLKKWEVYKQSKYFIAIQKQVTVDLELVEKEYLKHLKHKDIKLLRQVNSKFPQLSHDADFNMKFYSKITEYLRDLIHQFNDNNIKIINGEEIQRQGKVEIKFQNFIDNSKEKNSKMNSTATGFKKEVTTSTQNNKQKVDKDKNTDIKFKDNSQQKNNKKTLKTGQMIKAKAIKNIQKPQDQILKTNKVQNVQKFQIEHVQIGKKNKIQKSQNLLIQENTNTAQIKPQELFVVQSSIQAQVLKASKQTIQMNPIQQTHQQTIPMLVQIYDNILDPILQYDTNKQNNTILGQQKQPFQQIMYQKIPHAILQALQSLFQYYMLMQAKIMMNKDIHTNFSVVNLQHHYQDEKILTLIRQYSDVKLKQEDVTRIRNLTKFL